MNWKGKEIPIIYFYEDGKLVWDYVLPDEVEKTKYGFREKIVEKDDII